MPMVSRISVSSPTRPLSLGLSSRSDRVVTSTPSSAFLLYAMTVAMPCQGYE